MVFSNKDKEYLFSLSLLLNTILFNIFITKDILATQYPGEK